MKISKVCIVHPCLVGMALVAIKLGPSMYCGKNVSPSRAHYTRLKLECRYSYTCTLVCSVDMQGNLNLRGLAIEDDALLCTTDGYVLIYLVVVVQDIGRPNIRTMFCRVLDIFFIINYQLLLILLVSIVTSSSIIETNHVNVLSLSQPYTVRN